MEFCGIICVSLDVLYNIMSTTREHNRSFCSSSFSLLLLRFSTIQSSSSSLLDLLPVFNPVLSFPLSRLLFVLFILYTLYLCLLSPLHPSFHSHLSSSVIRYPLVYVVPPFDVFFSSRSRAFPPWPQFAGCSDVLLSRVIYSGRSAGLPHDAVCVWTHVVVVVLI